MKRKNLLIAISIILNAVLIILVMNSQIRISKLEDNSVQAYSNMERILEKNEPNNESSDEVKDDFMESVEKLEERVKDLEMNISTKQRLTLLEHSMGRIENLVFRREDIHVKYGIVTGIEADDTISLEVRPFKIAKGEEYIKKHGYAFIDLGLDNTTFELAKDCQIYFVSEIGLVKSTLENLVEKTEIEMEENFEDEYTFVLIDGKVVQIYQGYLP